MVQFVEGFDKQPGKIYRSKTYFFLEGKLYKHVTSNRAMGMVYAIDIDTQENVIISWKDMRRNSYWAYTPAGAAKILNRHRRTIIRLIRSGYVPQAYSIKTNAKQKYRHYLSKEAILQTHDILSISVRGAHRKDGIIVQKNIPTKEELQTELKNDLILYARTQDGDYARVWQAEDF